MNDLRDDAARNWPGLTAEDRALDDAQAYDAKGHLENIARFRATPEGEVYGLMHEIQNVMDALGEASTDRAKLDELARSGDWLHEEYIKFLRSMLRISDHRELMNMARGR